MIDEANKELKTRLGSRGSGIPGALALGVCQMLITNVDTKRPIRYRISGDNIFLEDK